MELSTRLRDEFEKRVRRNPRYSLRSFARALELHHTTLSRMLQGTRRASPKQIRRLSRPLGLSPADITLVLQQEAAARVLAAARSRGFRPDTRWLAIRTGLTTDDVNRALHLLIHTRRLAMTSAAAWTLYEA